MPYVLIFIISFSSFNIGFHLQRIIYDDNSHELLKECQQELPRNETCKIIAIPEGISDD